MITWEQIEKANDKIVPIEYEKSSKDKVTGVWEKHSILYSQVKDRVMAFRRVCPNGSILTSYTLTDNYIWYEALIYNEEQRLIAKGHARELLSKKYCERMCETSAVGRALGYCGIGITNGIASYEDMEESDNNEIFDEPVVSRKDLENEFTKLYSNFEQVAILNQYHVLSLSELPTQILMGYINEKHNTGR